LVGRPRSEHADRAILDTALRLLVAQGYDGMSMEAVAAAAGVGKPTVYRRYASKRELVIAALSSLVESLPHAPTTADVRADLLMYLEPAFEVFERGVGFTMLGALLVRERDDPELMQLFRERIVQPRMRTANGIMRRGIASGELRADAPIEAAVQMLAGSIFARHVAGLPADSTWLRLVIDVLWQGLAARRSASKPS
jgi:AcrR family transcriptional regulator